MPSRSDDETDRALDQWERYCRAAYDRHLASRGEVARPSDDAPWWIAVTNTNCERRASLGLRDRGFETWVAEMWREVTVGGAKTKTQACRRFLAAPGYVFARHADAAAWPEMVGVDGIAAIRCVDHRPQEVTAAEVELWKRQLAPDGMPVVEDAYRIGSEVRIVDGPLAGFRGSLSRVLASGGVEVAVTLFGAVRGVSVGRELVEPV